MTEPQYVHDCDNCIFLGQYMENDGTLYDLYFCSTEPTVIARYGEEGKYLSGLRFAIYDIFSIRETPLSVALKRAYERGIINIKITPNYGDS